MEKSPPWVMLAPTSPRASAPEPVVAGERRTRELKGILIDDPEKALGLDFTLPPPNFDVVLVGTKKE